MLVVRESQWRALRRGVMGSNLTVVAVGMVKMIVFGIYLEMD